jgi:hypothetical protein
MRDANRDGRQDVADVTTAGGREGMECGTTATAPPGHATGLDLDTRSTQQDGHTVIEVVASPAGAVDDLAGFEATVSLGAGAAGAWVEAADVIGSPWLLGPTAGSGTLRFAFAGDGHGLDAPAVIARIHLADGATATSASIQEAIATDELGGRYRVTADGVDVSPPTTVRTVYLPWVSRPGQ